MRKRHNRQKRPSDETKTRENRNQEQSESGEKNRNVPPSLLTNATQKQQNRSRTAARRAKAAPLGKVSDVRVKRRKR